MNGREEVVGLGGRRRGPDALFDAQGGGWCLKDARRFRHTCDSNSGFAEAERDVHTTTAETAIPEPQFGGLLPLDFLTILPALLLIELLKTFPVTAVDWCEGFSSREIIFLTRVAGHERTVADGERRWWVGTKQHYT